VTAAGGCCRACGEATAGDAAGAAYCAPAEPPLHGCRRRLLRARPLCRGRGCAWPPSDAGAGRPHGHEAYISFHHHVGRPPIRSRLLDVVAAHQHEAPMAVHGRGVHDRQPGLAVPAAATKVPKVRLRTSFTISSTTTSRISAARVHRMADAYPGPAMPSNQSCIALPSPFARAGDTRPWRRAAASCLSSKCGRCDATRPRTARRFSRTFAAGAFSGQVEYGPSGTGAGIRG